MSDVTRILSKIESGDQQASEELLPIVYNELRKLAATRLAGERADHTLQATALVHEAYLRLVNVNRVQDWDGRGHFFAAAAEAMRRILVDHARNKGAIKRGGKQYRVNVDDADLALNSPPENVLALDDALARLRELDPLAAELVNLRYFAGLSIKQAAVSMDISLATAYRHWNYARVWLHGELCDNA